MECIKQSFLNIIITKRYKYDHYSLRMCYFFADVSCVFFMCQKMNTLLAYKIKVLVIYNIKRIITKISICLM